VKAHASVCARVCNAMQHATELVIGCIASGEHVLLDVQRSGAAGAEVGAAVSFAELVAAGLPGLRVVRVSCSAQTMPEDIPAVVAGSTAHGRTRRTSLSKGKARVAGGDGSSSGTHLLAPDDAAAAGVVAVRRNKRSAERVSNSGDGLPAGVAHLRIAHVVFLERLHLVSRLHPLLQALLDVLARRKLPLHGSSIPVPAEAFTVVLVIPQPLSLPSVLLDHFLLRFSLGSTAGSSPISPSLSLPPSPLQLPMSTRDLMAMRERMAQVFMHLDVRQYMREIVVRLRNNEQIAAGTVSPRTVQMFEKAVRMVAVLSCSPFATPSHVLQVASLVLAHRIVPLSSAPTLTPSPSPLSSQPLLSPHQHADTELALAEAAIVATIQSIIAPV